MDRPPKTIGVVILTDGAEERACEVLGITPRTHAPSLDVRWSISGVYVLRLKTMVLLSIPKDRVRGRDETPWRCTNAAHAWSLWWNASLLPVKERRKRCPAEYIPKTSGCPAKTHAPCRFLFVGKGCVDCGGPRQREVERG